jgi:hypothetical protein
MRLWLVDVVSLSLSFWMRVRLTKYVEDHQSEPMSEPCIWGRLDSTSRQTCCPGQGLAWPKAALPVRRNPFDFAPWYSFFDRAIRRNGWQFVEQTFASKWAVIRQLSAYSCGKRLYDPND